MQPCPEHTKRLAALTARVVFVRKKNQPSDDLHVGMTSAPFSDEESIFRLATDEEIESWIESCVATGLGRDELWQRIAEDVREPTPAQREARAELLAKLPSIEQVIAETLMRKRTMSAEQFEQDSARRRALLDCWTKDR